MIRWLILIHRYLGIAIGLVMVLWCLSGIVMMYVQYPSVDKNLSLRVLEPINLEGCCQSTIIEQSALVDVNRFQLEMLAGEPVLHVNASNSQRPMFNLLQGEKYTAIDRTTASRISDIVQNNLEIDGSANYKTVQRDQWTVTNFYNRHRPLHQFTFDDQQKTQLYISNTTGELIQYSTGSQRFWNWFGAVSHWLYPTFLRQHNQLWAQLVIWLSIAGIFLTVVGIYIGVRQLVKRWGKPDLYRGWMLWHHYLGLFFGLFILTWVTSGLFSMNPWNMIDFSVGARSQNRLQGLPLLAQDVKRFIDRLANVTLPQDTARIEGYTLNGELFYLTYARDGSYQRFNGATLQAAPVDEEEWLVKKAYLNMVGQIDSEGLIHQDDAYYYSHHSPREFPVYRIIVNNRDKTRYYFNPISGELIAQLDRQQRAYRWMFNALHRGDFAAIARARPFWDVWMWVLLVGASSGCITGAYIGLRRVFKE